MVSEKFMLTRTDKLKSYLIKEIPFFPNDRETKKELECQSLLPVLLHYLTWKSRFVPQKPRKVVIEQYLKSDKRVSSLKKLLEELFSEIESGNDLTPYLSSKANSKGYTPARGLSGDKWADKDMILHTTGFHHFHFTKYPVRTDEVVFAKVSRDSFHAMAIFDHSVFKPSSGNSGALTKERARLMAIHSEYSSRGIPQGIPYADSIITTSAHPLQVVDMASAYNEIIFNNDPKLDDHDYISSIYKKVDWIIPKNNKLSWHLHGLDLGVIDKNNQFFVFREGPC